METNWKTWTLTIATAGAVTLLATGNGHILVDMIAATGIATADSLTWLISQGATR